MGQSRLLNGWGAFNLQRRGGFGLWTVGSGLWTVDSGIRTVELEQGLPNGLSDEAAHFGFAMESYFAFGGMDVHVHGSRSDFEKETADRVAPFHQGGVIAFEQGEVESAIFHGAAVDERVLVLAGGPGDSWGADETPKAEEGRGGRAGGRGERGEGGGLRSLPRSAGLVCSFIGRRQFGGEVQWQELLLGTVEGAQTFAQSGQAGGKVGPSFESGKLPDRAAVFPEGESDLREGEGGQRQIMLDVGRLGLLGAQELSAGGQVKKKLAHLDGRARGAACRFDLKDFAAVDDDLGGLGGIAFALAGRESETTDAGDAGERLATKAHGGDGGEVFGALDFARGMTLEAEQRIVAAHARAIVHDANEAASACLDFHGDAGGLSIQGIFDQFLDDAGRPLDDFARRDLIGDLLGQKANAVHGPGKR